MKEKVKPAKEQAAVEGGAFGGPFDGAPAPDKTQATLSSGQYRESLPIAGKKVGDVRKEYAAKFNISGQAVAIINKKQVSEDTVIGFGETVRFLHKTGEKGCV